MKIYNPQAPLHYNQYWSLEDEEPELKKMASDILMNYIQDWGQTNKERLDTLQEIKNKLGLDKMEKFDAFCEKIRSIERGNFESEVVQIASIIKEFSPKKKWWKFWD